MESFMLCNWIWIIHKLTLYFKALVLEATFPWPSSQEENYFSVTQYPTAFPVLPSILVLLSSRGVKLSRHWSVCSCFNEADKCHFLLGPFWQDADRLRGEVRELATKPAEWEADTCCWMIWAKKIILSGRKMEWTPNPYLKEEALHGWTLSHGPEPSKSEMNLMTHKIPSLMHLSYQYHYTKLPSLPLRKYLASFNNQNMTEPTSIQTISDNPAHWGPPASFTSHLTYILSGFGLSACI